MSRSVDNTSSHPPATREWAQQSLRGYLLGTLSPDQEDRITESLFLEPWLCDELREIEMDLMQEFVDRTLELDAVTNASLIRRWTEPEAKATLEVLRLKQAVQVPAAAVPVKEMPQKTKKPVLEMQPSRPRSWGRTAALATAAAVLLGTVLVSQWSQLQRENERLVQLAAGLQKQVSEAEAQRLAAEGEQPRSAQPVPLPANKRNPTSAQQEVLRAHLAGGEQTLQFRATDLEIALPPQAAFYWKVSPDVAGAYDVIVRMADGQSETRPLKPARGKVEIPIGAEELPVQFSIRNRITGETPVVNIKVVNGVPPSFPQQP